MLLLLGMVVMGCSPKPRVIQSESIYTSAQTANQAAAESPQVLLEPPSVEHEVKVLEVLNTEKYTYLKVSENEEEFWVATSKMPAEVGQTYFYRDGLLKKNFYSQKFNRVFDKVYLVSRIRRAQGLHKSLPGLQAGEVVPAAPGTVSLATLFANRAAYDGQVIKITGKCVKINPMIMNRNWLHIQDGSGKDLDLTVTTNEIVTLGRVVSLEGKIALNKDFGAGYRYEIIMEEAQLR